MLLFDRRELDSRVRLCQRLSHNFLERRDQALKIFGIIFPSVLFVLMSRHVHVGALLGAPKIWRLFFDALVADDRCVPSSIHVLVFISGTPLSFATHVYLCMLILER